MAMEGTLNEKLKVVDELSKLSAFDDDGESSTVVVENQLHHLETLLAEAETEVGAKGITQHPRVADIAELNSILGRPESILHYTTPENILDVLGFSEESKVVPRKRPLAVSSVAPKQTDQFLVDEEYAALAALIPSGEENNAPEKPDEADSNMQDEERGTSDVSSSPQAEERDSPSPTEEVEANATFSASMPADEKICESEEVEVLTGTDEKESTVAAPTEEAERTPTDLSPEEEDITHEKKKTEAEVPADTCEAESESTTRSATPWNVNPELEFATGNSSGLDADAAIEDKPKSISDSVMENATLAVENRGEVTEETPLIESQALEETTKELVTPIEETETAPESCKEGAPAAATAVEEKESADPWQPETMDVSDEERSDASNEEVDANESGVPRAEEAEEVKNDPICDNDVEVMLEDHVMVHDEQPAKEEEAAQELLEEAAQELVEEEAKKEHYPHDERDVAVETETEHTERVEGEGHETKEKHPSTDEELENVDDEKNDDDSIEVVVVPDDRNRVENRRESDTVEVVLPGGENVDESCREDKRDTNVSDPPQTPHEDDEPSLPEDIEEGYVADATSDSFFAQSSQRLTNLKDEVKKLKDDYSKDEENSKFESLIQHVQHLRKKLEESQADVAQTNAELAESKIFVAELRDELASKQARYETEVQSRLQREKTIQEMADLVQNTCKDPALVQQIVSLAGKVDSQEDALAVPAMKATDETNSVAESQSAVSSNSSESQEENPKVDKTAKEQGGYMSYIKACVWTT